MAGYRRILLKLSGQSLAGPNGFGIHTPTLRQDAGEIAKMAGEGHQVAIVIGAGNIFRGVSGAAEGMDRATADQMGMLATVINCLALGNALEQEGSSARVLSAVPVGGIVDAFRRGRAIGSMDDGNIVILAAGTGNPYFTTDTAAALRAGEIGADVLVKATRVDGVYDKDPEKFDDAERFDELSYDEVIRRGLGVMDMAAFLICRDNRIPILVLDLHESGNIGRAAKGERVGTLVRG